MSDPEVAELVKKLKILNDDFNSFKSEVNIVGGIFIGIVICLIVLFIVFYVLLRSIPKRFDKSLDKLDPLRKFTVYNKHTMMQERSASPSLTNSLPSGLNVNTSHSPTPSNRKSPAQPGKFDFPLTNNQQSAPNTPKNEMHLKVPTAVPRRLQSNIDSPLHSEGKSPSVLAHFEFPPTAARLEKQMSQVSQDGRRGPVSPY